jgi:hypothetical protein
MNTNVIDSFSQPAPVAPPTSVASPQSAKLIAHEQKIVSKQVRKSEHNDKKLKSSLGSDSMGSDSLSLGDSMGSSSDLLWFTQEKD